MSDAPDAGWDSGTEGFAPIDDGFTAPDGSGPPLRDTVPLPILIPESPPIPMQAPGYAPQPYPVYPVYPVNPANPAYHGAVGYSGPPGYAGYSGYPGYPSPAGYSTAPGYPNAPVYPGFPNHPGGYYGPPMLRRQTSGLAVTGLVLGILSLLLFWASLLAPLLAVSGIIFGVLGIVQSSKPGWTGMAMAVTGVVCSVLTAAIWVALVILLASLIA